MWGVSGSIYLHAGAEDGSLCKTTFYWVTLQVLLYLETVTENHYFIHFVCHFLFLSDTLISMVSCEKPNLNLLDYNLII